MGLHAQLIAVNSSQLESAENNTSTVLRYSKGIIPLFWWAMYDRDDLIQHQVSATNTNGTPSMTDAWTLWKHKTQALKALNEFADAVQSVSDFPQPTTNYIYLLRDQIQDVSAQSLQLDTYDLQRALGAEDFLSWIDLGCSFSNDVRLKRLLKLKDAWLELLEFSAIYESEEYKPTGAVPFNKEEFAARAAELAKQPVAETVAPSLTETQLLSTDWEHSLIGWLFDGPTQASRQEASTAPKPWWNFWK